MVTVTQATENTDMDYKQNKALLLGFLTLTKKDINGIILFQKRYSNLVMPAGEVYVANMVCSGSITKLSDISIGDGTTNPTVSDTALESELVKTSVIGSPTQDITSFSIGAVLDVGIEYLNITESGLFYGSSMFSRLVFDPIDKETEQSLHLLWEITVNGEVV